MQTSPAMNDISLSAFFPCYNEGQNLEHLVVEAIQVLTGLVEKYEILIINDGSADRTGAIADRLSKQYGRVRVIHHKENRGYGAALISGFRNAILEWVFFTDGDLQFFMAEIERLLRQIDDYDLVIGYRKSRRDPWYRILYGRAWTRLVQVLFGLKVRDINCAFKLIKREILDGITLDSSGAMINTELMVRATMRGARVKQVGVSHRPRRFGKQTGGSPKVILRAFAELFELWKQMKD